MFKMGVVLDSDDYLFVITILIFLLINFNLAIGQIYHAMAISAVVFYYIARDLGAFKPIPVNAKKLKLYHVLAIGVVSYAAFIFFTSQVLPMMGYTDYSGFNSVIGLMSQTFSQAPALADSNVVTFATWGYFIPWVETMFFFGVLIAWAAHYAKVNLNKGLISLPIIVFTAVFSFIFVFFHITAKGITNNPALIATFIFGFISIMLVLYYKEMRPAITFHVISNTLATMYLLNIQLFAVAGTKYAGYVPLIGLAAVAYLLLKRYASVFKTASEHLRSRVASGSGAH